MPAAVRSRNWGWYSLVLLGGFGLAAAVATLVDTVSFCRTMGGILELLGLLAVAKGISDVRRHFGLPSTFSEALADFRVAARDAWRRGLRAFGLGPAAQTVGLPTIPSGATLFAPAVGTAGLPLDMSLEAQITRLQQRLDGIEGALRGVQDELRRETEQLRDAIAFERQGRVTDYEQLRTRLEDFAVGGLRLETVGLVWLFAGVILATWAS